MKMVVSSFSKTLINCEEAISYSTMVEIDRVRNNVNEDLKEILYYYDNYDSIEHLHHIHLNNGVIKFEYYNELDETICK